MAKFPSGDKTNKAIKAAWAELGRTAKAEAVIELVQSKIGHYSMSWQRVVGIKSRMRPGDWTTMSNMQPAQPGTSKKSKESALAGQTTVEWDEIITTTYKPGDIYKDQPAVLSTTTKTHPEIVYLLNACIDRTKLSRLLNYDDLTALGDAVLGEINFDVKAMRFRLDTNPCDSL